jgi:hypothetical protein
MGKQTRNEYSNFEGRRFLKMWLVVGLMLIGLVTCHLAIRAGYRGSPPSSSADSGRARVFARASAWSVSVAAAIALVLTVVLVIDKEAFEVIPIMVFSAVTTMLALWYASRV